MSNITKGNEQEKSTPGLKESFLHMNIMLVRNYNDLPFASAMSDTLRKEFEDRFISFMIRKKKNLTVLETESLSKEKKLQLYNRGLWLPELEKEKNIKILFSQDTAIILNYKNHLTILGASELPVFKPVYKKVQDLEKKAGEFSDFLACERYGYVSPLLDECGLGFRISAIMHFNGISGFITMSKNEKGVSANFEKMQQNFFDRGYLLRKSGFMENNGDTDYYEIASRFNFGVTESELMERFMEGLKDFATLEQQAIEMCRKNNFAQIEDSVFRSLGILKYARMLSFNEAMYHLSRLRTGVKMHLPIPIDLDRLNTLQQTLFTDSSSDNENECLANRAAGLRTLLEGK